jgi:hypothetical protein
MRARTTVVEPDLKKRRWTAATARAALEAWRKSGLSLAGFARTHGVGVWRLGWWRKRMEGGAQRRATPIVPLTFIPATVASAGRTRIAVRLPGGVEIEAADAEALPAGWVAALVRQLRAS